MAQYIKYVSTFSELSSEENSLLKEALLNAEKFVKKSSKISKTNYATRDAHAKAYAFLEGFFIPEKSGDEKMLWEFDEYKVCVRLSHANLKINSSDKQLPLYGYSLKISIDHHKEINYPLVNFPVFITNSVSKFLKIFIKANRLFTESLWRKPYVFFSLSKTGLSIIPEIVNTSFFNAIKMWVKSFQDFILFRTYYSIGAYRFGDRMIKLQIVPKNYNESFVFSGKTHDVIRSYLSENEILYDVLYQVSKDARKQPINVLTKLWKDSEFKKLGTIRINSVLDNNEILENLSFSPFDNPEEYQPVGKIQFLRKAAYKTSFETRITFNSNK